MTIISINYIEPDTKTYKGIDFSNKKNIKTFYSGDFEKDWFLLNKYLILDFCQKNKGESIVFSSSVDHFIMDSSEFESAYLKVKDNEPILIYEYEEGLTEFFIKKKTRPTWEQLKSKHND